MYINYPNNFGEIPKKYSDYKNSKIAILSVPFENSTTYLKGASKGPKAIIKASAYMELYDKGTDTEIYKKGICTLKPLKTKKSQKDMINKVYQSTKQLLADKKFPIIFGGEHSVSIGAVKALKEKYSSLSVLSLDAHADLKNNCNGKNTNPCVARRILEISPITIAGVRSLNKQEADFIKKNKTKVFFSKDIYNNKKIFNNIVRGLSDNIYITIDLDVFNILIMPSVGTPEPGGLDWYIITGLLKELAKNKNVVGFDIVELSPRKGFEFADFTAAKLCYKLINYVFSKK